MLYSFCRDARRRRTGWSRYDTRHSNVAIDALEMQQRLHLKIRNRGGLGCIGDLDDIALPFPRGEAEVLVTLADERRQLSLQAVFGGNQITYPPRRQCGRRRRDGRQRIVGAVHAGQFPEMTNSSGAAST